MDHSFPNITVSSVNCNSLNMSTIGTTNHLLKIHGIVSLLSDIIILSDIRLCNSAGISNSNEITNSLRSNPYCSYRLISNSHKSKRGVGILLKNSLPFSVLSEFRDQADNILGLRLDLQGKIFSVCAIYGPNSADPGFFDDLNACRLQMDTDNTIFGGDWNFTVCCLNDESNLDIINMRTPPNHRHSVLLREFCENFGFSDPFRTKYPLRTEFTYQPSATAKVNRSRIDFFVVSNNLIDQIKKCSISPNLQNKMFDHKAVHLSFRAPSKVIRTPTISRSLLNDPDIDIIVKLAIFETYLHHTAELTDANRRQLLTMIGTSKQEIINAGPDSNILPLGHRSAHEELVRSGILAGIKDRLEMVPIELMSGGVFRDGLEDDLFMETLVNNIKNECIGYQAFISRTVKNSMAQMFATLEDLKLNFQQNSTAIFELERKLDQVQDCKLRSKLENTRNFELINNEKLTPNFLNLSKGSKAEASLSDLKDDLGREFESENDMKTYVRKFMPICTRVQMSTLTLMRIVFLTFWVKIYAIPSLF